jgi:hypothetical protein
MEGPMADVQITCINKQPRNNPYEGITHVGNSQGRWPRDQVVDWIRSGAHTFFTSVNGKRADIGVVDGPNGPYLQTYADDAWNNNLLALPECR